jgi:hypothetical protein
LDRRVLSPGGRRLQQDVLIEGEIFDGKATLSAELEQYAGNHYEFKLQDKLRQDISAPAAVKIEQLPKHGKISVTEHDGTVRELKVGDVVPTQLMSKFVYEQGEEGGCSEQNEASCKDAILFSTVGTWFGFGQEASAWIKLTPVAGSAPAVQAAAPSAAKSESAATQELAEEETQELEATAGGVTEAAGCQTYPADVINIMIGVSSILCFLAVCVVGYYLYAKKQVENKKTAEEADKDFNAIATERKLAPENAQ